MEILPSGAHSSYLKFPHLLVGNQVREQRREAILLDDRHDTEVCIVYIEQLDNQAGPDADLPPLLFGWLPNLAIYEDL